MHVLIDARLYSPTFGIGRYTFELVKAFLVLRPDWHFTLMMPSKEAKNASFPKHQVTIITADEPIYSVSEQTSFLTKLMKVPADITWFPHFSLPLFYPKPFVVSVHDLTISKFPGKKKSSWLHRMAYHITLKNALYRSKCVFTVSEHTKKDIIEMEKISPEKITVAYNAVGEEYFSYTSNPNIDISKMGIIHPFFFYAGNWREHKNILGLIKGFHQFIKTSNSKYQLVVSGKEDPLYPEFLEYRKKENLESVVITPGLVSEQVLMELYKKAYAFVFPSFYEGFGLPPLEAMAMGTCVIASNTSCIPEVCGDAAVYFDPYDENSLSKALEEYTNSQEIQNSLQQKGYIQAKKYDWNASAEILLKKMEECSTI